MTLGTWGILPFGFSIVVFSFYLPRLLRVSFVCLFLIINEKCRRGQSRNLKRAMVKKRKNDLYFMMAFFFFRKKGIFYLKCLTDFREPREIKYTQ